MDSCEVNSSHTSNKYAVNILSVIGWLLIWILSCEHISNQERYIISLFRGTRFADRGLEGMSWENHMCSLCPLFRRCALYSVFLYHSPGAASGHLTPCENLTVKPVPYVRNAQATPAFRLRLATPLDSVWTWYSQWSHDAAGKGIFRSVYVCGAAFRDA